MSSAAAIATGWLIGFLLAMLFWRIIDGRWWYDREYPISFVVAFALLWPFIVTLICYQWFETMVIFYLMDDDGL